MTTSPAKSSPAPKTKAKSNVVGLSAHTHTCHKEHLVRLKRVEGQIRGIVKMIEDEKYCIDIIGQLRAARSALGAVEAKVLSKHLKTCLNSAFSSRDEELIDKKVDELVEFILRSGK